MDVLNELAANAIDGLEKENLINFMRSFCGDLTRAGEISEKDKTFAEAFKKVYEAALAVDEKTKQLEASDIPSDDDIRDATERLGEIRSAVDRLQTSALSNPILLPFAKKVASRARKMCETLEQFTKKEDEGDFRNLYERFKSL